MAKPTKKPKESAEEPGFEQTLERLEAVVDRLGEGELQLEESLAAFEDGVRLSRECAKQLEAVEKRIEVLTKDREGWTVSPLDPESEDEG